MTAAKPADNPTCHHAADPSGPCLERVVTPVAAAPWLGLAEAVERPTWFAWCTGDTTVVACGEVAALSARDREAWRTFLTRVESAVAFEPDSLPLAVGGCSFARRPGTGTWEGWPSHELTVPERIWVTRGTEAFTIEHRWQGCGRPPTVQQVRRSQRAAVGWQDVESPEAWNAAVSSALSELASDKLGKVVLARRVRAEDPRARVDAVASLEALHARYPGAITFAMARPRGGLFLGATPETLVRVRAGRVATEALAGTLARGQGDAAVLEGSTKDLAEHRWTADMVERTLRRHCSEVTRDGPRAVQFRDLFHLRTELSATLRDPQALLTLVDELHPTPAVGGSPRDRALQLIDRLETFDRGWYAAPIGWLASDGDGHFAVALRSALCGEHGADAFAGAGIVLGSEPEAEWRETATKLLPATTCLQWIQEA